MDATATVTAMSMAPRTRVEVVVPSVRGVSKRSQECTAHLQKRLLSAVGIVASLALGFLGVVFGSMIHPGFYGCLLFPVVTSALGVRRCIRGEGDCFAISGLREDQTAEYWERRRSVYQQSAPSALEYSSFPPQIAITPLEAISVEESREIYRFLDRPLCLQNNAFNCWINACLHLFVHVPTYRTRLQEEESEVKRGITAYLEAQRNRDFKVDFPTQRLREWLFEQTLPPLVALSPHVQEDPVVMLEHLFHRFEIGFLLEQRFRPLNGNVSIQRVREVLLTVRFDEDLPDDFPTLFCQAFCYENEEQGEFLLNFLEIPDDLLLQVARFSFDRTTQRRFKISTPLNVPSLLPIPGECFSSGEPQFYCCDAIIVHQGVSDEAGHYVTYLKKPQGWWKCQDLGMSLPYLVSLEEVKRAFLQGYLYHFVRKKEEERVPPLPHSV